MNEARLIGRALTDRVVQVHAGCQDALLVEHLDLEAVLLADALCDLRQGLRVELVGRLVDGVARDAHGVADRYAEVELLLVLGRELAGDEHADLAELGLGLAVAGEVTSELVSAEHDALANGA